MTSESEQFNLAMEENRILKAQLAASPVVPVKRWYQSRTIWVAVFQAMAGLLTVLIASDPHLQTAGGLALMKSAIDVLLRFLTNVPVGDMPTVPPAQPNMG